MGLTTNDSTTVAWIESNKKNFHNPAMMIAAMQLSLSITLNEFMSLEGSKVRDITDAIKDVNNAMNKLRDYSVVSGKDGLDSSSTDLTNHAPWKADNAKTLEDSDYYKIRQVFIKYEDDGKAPDSMTADGKW